MKKYHTHHSTKICEKCYIKEDTSDYIIEYVHYFNSRVLQRKIAKIFKHK
jgi:hypothetical protein